MLEGIRANDFGSEVAVVLYDDIVDTIFPYGIAAIF